MSGRIQRGDSGFPTPQMGPSVVRLRQGPRLRNLANRLPKAPQFSPRVSLRGKIAHLGKAPSLSAEQLTPKINEIAKRFGIQPDLVRAAAVAGKLQKLEQNLTKVANQYKKDYPFSVNQLLSITAIAFNKLQDNQSTYFIANKTRITASKDSQEQIEISFDKKVLGEGSFGVVKQTEVLGKKSPKALKYLKENFDSAAVRMLEKIHQGGRKMGIQAPYKRVLNLVSGKKCLRSKEYHGDGHKIKNFKGERALSGMRQLFKGLDQLQKLNICHKDIKPANLLFKEKDGELTVDIADFDDAEELKGYASDNRGLHTPLYTCSYDQAALHSTPHLRDEILMRGDTFSLCLSICEMVCGSDNINNTSGISRKLKKAGIPDDIRNLLLRGLNNDYSARPTPQDFLNALAK